MRAMLGWSVGNSRLKDSKPPTARLIHACTSNTVYSVLPALRDIVKLSLHVISCAWPHSRTGTQQRFSLPHPCRRGSWWRRTRAARKSLRRPVQTSSPGSGGCRNDSEPAYGGVRMAGRQSQASRTPFSTLDNGWPGVGGVLPSVEGPAPRGQALLYKPTRNRMPPSMCSVFRRTRRCFIYFAICCADHHCAPRCPQRRARPACTCCRTLCERLPAVAAGPRRLCAPHSADAAGHALHSDKLCTTHGATRRAAADSLPCCACALVFNEPWMRVFMIVMLLGPFWAGLCRQPRASTNKPNFLFC